MTDEGGVKRNTAIKFLIPAKFNVIRAVELYRTHEVSIMIRKNIFSRLFFFRFRIYVGMKILIEFILTILI